MASDIYNYRGKIGNVVVKVSYIDYPKGHSHSEGARCLELSRDGHAIMVSPASTVRIYQWIADDKLQLEYLGGYCSNGTAWGPDEECLEMLCPHCGNPM